MSTLTEVCCFAMDYFIPLIGPERESANAASTPTTAATTQLLLLITTMINKKM